MQIKAIPRSLENTRLKNGFTRNELSRKAKVSKITIRKLEDLNDYSPNAHIAKKYVMQCKYHLKIYLLLSEELCFERSDKMTKWIPMEKAANIEGVKYNTMIKRISRAFNNYQTELRPNPNGGKPLVYVALSSLSAQAQRLYKAQTQPPASKAKIPDTEPWYITADVIRH